ncbi:MAG TPA: cupin-like domain-containing protein [Steroidobacteraceae bacterium]|nr:cupin-like domain-containing protein [Steroidobacteraceae bacterium]
MRGTIAMRPAEIDARSLTNPETFLREVAEPCRPAVIRGLVAAWPAVRAAANSPAHFRDYVLQFDAGGQTEVFVGEPRIAGKYYYSDDLHGFNFSRSRMSVADALDSIIATAGRAGQHSMYVGSLPTDPYLPGFAAQNALPILSTQVTPRIWFGHASNVSAHYDTFDNVACVVAGMRRFTLYAPETIGRLYVGPLDHTMAGQPVSLAASAPADDERYPLFREVREQALVAELHPGDAIYVPKLWWHQVEATSTFNVLVNYWWDAFAIGRDAPSVGLLLSMITIAERPPAERQAWKAFFDHYVFRTNGHPLAHLPPDQHGVLGPLQPDNYEKIRARVMHLLRGG